MFHTYECSWLYTEKMKHIHNAKLKSVIDFKKGDKLLLYNSRLRLFPGKFQSRLSGPFEVTQSFPYVTVEITHPDQGTFKFNGYRLKLYLGANPTDRVEVPCFEDAQ